jgi:F-type H+-transporting ATPase subunit delta
VSVQARPQDYAAAIYDLAFEPWTRQLSDVQKLLKEDAALSAAFRDPELSTSDKLQMLNEARPGELSPDVRKFLGTLLEAGQLDQIDSILVEFERLVRRRAKRQVAHVTTAVPLTDSEKAAMQAKLTARFGPDLEFQFEVNDSLIGGVYLRVGDQVIDGTVAGKLAAMRDRLTA